MFIYESHLGGIYYKDEYLDFDDRYCEDCGDCDTYLGEANTMIEALEVLHDRINEIYTDEDACAKCRMFEYDENCADDCDKIWNTGGYDKEEIMADLKACFGEEDN